MSHGGTPMSFGEFMDATGGTGRHVHLCVRVTDMPDPVAGSVTRDCAGCGQQVWYDPKSSVYAPGEVIACGQCFDDWARARGWPG